MSWPKGKPRPPGAGRKPGTPNKITREMKDLMNQVLFDNPELTRVKLEALRDSDDASDRKTFWAIAAKMLPQKVEGKIEADLPLLVLSQDYVRGQTRELTQEEYHAEYTPDSVGEEERQWEK